MGQVVGRQAVSASTHDRLGYSMEQHSSHCTGPGRHNGSLLCRAVLSSEVRIVLALSYRGTAVLPPDAMHVAVMCSVEVRVRWFRAGMRGAWHHLLFSFTLQVSPASSRPCSAWSPANLAALVYLCAKGPSSSPRAACRRVLTPHTAMLAACAFATLWPVTAHAQTCSLPLMCGARPALLLLQHAVSSSASS
jgi:hypothetical protein